MQFLLSTGSTAKHFSPSFFSVLVTHSLNTGFWSLYTALPEVTIWYSGVFCVNVASSRSSVSEVPAL